MSKNSFNPAIIPPYMNPNSNTKDIAKSLRQYMQQVPGRPASQKVNLTRIGDFVFDKMPGNIKTDEQYQAIADLIAHTIASSYFRKYYTLTVDNDNLWKNPKIPTSINLKEFASKLRTIIAHYGSTVSFRVEGPSYVEEIMFTEETLDDTTFIRLSNIQFQTKRNIARVNLSVLRDNIAGWNDVSGGSWYTSKRWRDGETELRANSKYAIGTFESNGGVTDYMMLVVMDHILEIIVDNIDGLVDCVIRNHTPCEMYFIKKFIIQNGDPVLRNAIISSIIDTSNEHKPSARKILDGYRNIGVVNVKALRDAPLVDLNNREKGWVAKYLGEKRYLGMDRQGIDLVEYLTHPRYGKDLHMQIPDDLDDNIISHMTIGGKLDELLTNRKPVSEVYHYYTTYTLDPVNDHFRFIAVYMLSESKVVALIMDFINIRHFNIIDNLLTIERIFTQDDDDFIAACGELEDMLPSLLFSTDGALTILCETLAIHIMNHERPRRTRMIQYRPRNISHDPKVINDPPPEYVVRRILKPLAEATRLVKQSTGGEIGDRIYTMESWTRTGHWRRLPHSEELIWIKEKTYHRKDELIDHNAKIHLKL